MTIFFAFLLAYLLGSIPFGLLVSYFFFGIDIREHGSRNIGATNVLRVIGKRAGLSVLALDALKGYLSVQIPLVLGLATMPFPFRLGLGLAAIIGHSFPVWLRFKGGKGVATSLGVFLGLAFLPTLITFVLWCVIFSIARIVSIASIAAAIAFPVVLTLFMRSQPQFPWLLGISILLVLFILFTHRANIRRLLRGEEKKLL